MMIEENFDYITVTPVLEILLPYIQMSSRSEEISQMYGCHWQWNLATLQSNHINLGA